MTDIEVTGRPYDERPYIRVRYGEGLAGELRRILLDQVERLAADSAEPSQRIATERTQQLLELLENSMVERGWLR